MARHGYPMTRHPKTRSRAKLLRSLYLWHRYLGLSAALFVILLAITGLALNHTEALDMDATHVQSDLLLDWYGIHAPEKFTSFSAGNIVFSEVNQHIYQETKRLVDLSAPLLGAVTKEGFIILASRDQLTLLSSDGEVIEHLGSAAGVPAGMQSIGTAGDDRIVIRAAHGYYLTDESFLEWEETDTIEAAWSGQTPTPPELAAALRKAYRGSGLTLERIILDLHSGRILGNAGVLLVDAAAILFLILAFSGVWLWGRRRASARAHRRKMDGQ
jgi:hypothetical protein